LTPSVGREIVKLLTTPEHTTTLETFDLTELDMRTRATLLEGLVYPRPIAWISTESPDGRQNLAPFSFFNLFSPAPPTIVVAPGTRPVASDPPHCVDKDTLANIRATGEFVVSLISEALVEHANATSADIAPDESEWALARVTQRPCDDVRPPMVAESPASLECRVLQVIDLDQRGKRTNALVVARVTRCHVMEGVLDEAGRADPNVLRLVGRIGGPRWCRTTDWIDLKMPGR